MMEKTEDKFLGGALNLLQPKHGYRAGADPVLLASAVDARPGQSVLELGCGVGTALLCLMHRVSGLDSVGIERDPDLTEMARANVERNALSARIVQADLNDLPNNLRTQSFDHVLANPPFFDRARGPRSKDATREGGRGEDTPLEIWIDTATRRLKPGGSLTLVQRTARLQEIMRLFDDRMGSLRIVPLASRQGRDAENVIVMARKGGRGVLKVDAPLVLHDGTHHLRDGDSYSLAAKAVLRDGRGLDEAKLMRG